MRLTGYAHCCRLRCGAMGWAGSVDCRPTGCTRNARWKLLGSGLVPVTGRPYGTGVLSAPGARADAVNTLRQASAPQTIPPLETEVRQMVVALMAAAQARGNAAGLPQVAIEAKAAPTATAEAPMALR